MSTSTSTVTSTRRRNDSRAIADFFAVHGLPSDSAEALADVSRLRRRNRRGPMMLGVGRAAFFLVDGRVAELVQPGKVRLWRELMLFESVSNTASFAGTHNVEGSSSNSKELVAGASLSGCVFVEVPNSKLTSLAMIDPAIALMLARMAAKRHALTEQLYSATRATPVTRVAAVLNYLAEPSRRRVARSRNGVLVMTTTEELVASGPSQTDIADALCLGRATVEKAIAELRQVKALRSFERGERANRCYPIEDRDLLRQISIGG